MRGRDAIDANLDRLAFDAGRWFASKMAPKLYGERMKVETTGHRRTGLDLSWLTPKQIAALFKVLRAGAVERSVITLDGELDKDN